MTKKQEQDAIFNLEKLEELTQDILKNTTSGGDINFRQIVFSGLTTTKNKILLEKMQELLLSEKEEDLKKTIIIGVFSHKEIFEPIIEYGQYAINVPYIDESYDDKESFLLVLDALIELAYKNKLDSFETALPLFMQIFKVSCSEKSTSTMADKLLQRLLNSKIGTVKIIQKEFLDLIQSKDYEMNCRVIAVDILARAKTQRLLDVILDTVQLVNDDNIAQMIPLLDVSTLALSYYTDKKYLSKVKKIVKIVQNIDLKLNTDTKDTIERIIRRITKLQDIFNSNN